MTTLPILPLFLVAALPTDPPPSETNQPPHPHYQKVTKLAGVGGNVSVSWFTVPHNQEQVDRNKKPGYLWSRGFQLSTDVDLMFGKVKVGKGNYALGFQLDEAGKSWSVVLMGRTKEMQDVIGQMRRAGRDREARQKLMAKYRELQMKSRLTLPTKSFKAPSAEHMALTGINHGYKCKSRRDPSPISGIDGEIRVSFGDLHVMVNFAESFTPPPAKAGKDGGGNQERRRRRRVL